MVEPTEGLPPEEGKLYPPSVDEVLGLRDDSGIGTSDASSSSREEHTLNPLYGLGGNPGFSRGASDDSSSARGHSADDATSDKMTPESAEPPYMNSGKHSIDLSYGTCESARKLQCRRSLSGSSLGLENRE